MSYKGSNTKEIDRNMKELVDFAFGKEKFNPSKDLIEKTLTRIEENDNYIRHKEKSNLVSFIRLSIIPIIPAVMIFIIIMGIKPKKKDMNDYSVNIDGGIADTQEELLSEEKDMDLKSDTYDYYEKDEAKEKVILEDLLTDSDSIKSIIITTLKEGEIVIEEDRFKEFIKILNELDIDYYSIDGGELLYSIAISDMSLRTDEINVWNNGNLTVETVDGDSVSMTHLFVKDISLLEDFINIK